MANQPNHSKPVPPSPRRGPISLVSGASYPLRALRLLWQTPRLWGFVAVPIAVNIVLGITLYAALFYGGWQGIDTAVEALAQRLPTGLSFVTWVLPVFEWLLRLLLGLLLLIGTGFVLLQFGVLLGSPWYGQLSEELEKLRTGKTKSSEPFNMLAIARDLWRAILFELKKLVLSLGIGIPLLLFHFVPGVGTAIASTGGITLAATIVCLDFFDPPLERRRLSFRHKLNLIRRSLPASGTFGLVSFVLVSIPLVNLIAIPVCITAGTLFFCDRLLVYLESDALPTTKSD